MVRFLTTLILVGASVAIQADRSISPTNRSVNPVVQWNKTLLSIVRTPGAQPRRSIRPAVLPFCTRQSMMPSMLLTGRMRRTWFAFLAFRAGPHQTPRQLQPRTRFS